MWNWVNKHILKKGNVGANASFYQSCTDGVELYNNQQEQLVQSRQKKQIDKLNKSEVCGTDELTPMYMNSKMAPVNHYTAMDGLPYETSMKYISKKYHDSLAEKTKNTGFYSPEHKARHEARQFKGGRSRKKRRTRARRTRRYSLQMLR